MIGIASVAVIYTLVQVVVSGTLIDPAATQRPIADSAMAVLGSRAAAAISIGALFSHLRLSRKREYAAHSAADRRCFPAGAGRYSRHFRANSSAISNAGCFHCAVHGVSARVHAGGKFSMEHHAFGDRASICLWLDRDCPTHIAKAQAACGRVSTAGRTAALAIVAILFCVVLLLRAPLSNSTAVLVTSAAAAVNWALVRRRPGPA